MAKNSIYYATGKRKSAAARTWLKPGKGEVIVNDRALEDYFDIEGLRTTITQPFVLTNTLGTFDVKVTVMGGGIHGQADAIRHGITGALIKVNPELRQVLKKAGFVRRDPRRKERKKYGQKGARARFQFSKR